MSGVERELESDPKIDAAHLGVGAQLGRAS